MHDIHGAGLKVDPRNYADRRKRIDRPLPRPSEALRDLPGVVRASFEGKATQTIRLSQLHSDLPAQHAPILLIVENLYPDGIDAEGSGLDCGVQALRGRHQPGDLPDHSEFLRLVGAGLVQDRERVRRFSRLREGGPDSLAIVDRNGRGRRHRPGLAASPANRGLANRSRHGGFHIEQTRRIAFHAS
ncbi:hypothetical protein [Nocardioides sp. GXZ039]|uniref:hypothetical protein n=1 Tax=Nocardioides sp. GXZ039 TaxID=3136018 RepID=UPI0030F491DC